MSDTESPMAKAVREIEADRRAAAGLPPAGSDAPVKKIPEANANIRAIVDRIVRLEEEKQGISADIKGIYQEAKSAGFGPKAVKIAVKREMETAEKRAAREAEEAEAQLIIAALGEFVATPLGEAEARAGRG